MPVPARRRCGLAGVQGPVDHVLEHLPAERPLGLALLDHVVELHADEVLRVADDAGILERLLHPQCARIAAAGRNGVGGPGVRGRRLAAAVVQLGGELGQCDLGAEHAAEVPQEFGQPAARQQGAGQDLVPGDQPLELRIVVGGLRVGHELADGDERGAVRHFDHRQPPAVGFRDQSRRNGVVREPHAEPDPHGAGALDLADKAALFGRTFHPQPGGQHQFAAVEEALRVLQFGDRHPVDVLVRSGLREAGFLESQGLHGQQRREGNCHGSRVAGGWPIALKRRFKGVQVAIPRGVGLE